MHLFYTPDITTNEYTLPEEESKHCVKVLRLEVGDEIYLIDGKGGFYRCEIIQAQPKRCEVRCVEKMCIRDSPYPYRICWLFVASWEPKRQSCMLLSLSSWQPYQVTSLARSFKT